MRTERELLNASGYTDRPKDFAALMYILDAELRLITPADPEGVNSGSATQRPRGEKYYQLTHDYLVPSLRNWLARERRSTRRGRMELLLAEQAAEWNAKPENRRLPSWWEWLNIRLLTRRKDWTDSQRRMLRKAGRYHAVRGLAFAVAFLVVTALTLVLQTK
jgi:hypothetical protein